MFGTLGTEVVMIERRETHDAEAFRNSDHRGVGAAEAQVRVGDDEGSSDERPGVNNQHSVAPEALGEHLVSVGCALPRGGSPDAGECQTTTGRPL